MLHIKYRPNHWNQVVGNSGTVNYLKTVADNPERPHSYLMTGPSGCGKTTLARILAAELGCSGSDFTEIDVGDYRGIDSVREIRQVMSLTPMVSSCRVWLLDECHRLTSDAQAALLKALEDAPKYAYFILATTDPKKLLPTILNRCTPCPVKPLTEEEMKRLLTRAARGENRAKDLTQEVVDSIIEVADGAPRAGLVVLEKYLANPEAPIVSLGESTKEIIDLCRLLLKKQSWRAVSKTLQALKGQDPEEIRRAVLGYCAAVLLKGVDDPQALALLDIFREPFYNSGWPGVVWACCLSVQKG